MHSLVLIVAALLAPCHCRHFKHIDIDNSIAPLDRIPHANWKRENLWHDIVLTKRVGTIVELTCEGNGSPAPSVHWFRNHAPVFEHDLESNEIMDTRPTSVARVSSTLLLPRADAAEYTCLIRSGHNTTRASIIVDSTDGATDIDLSERTKLVPLAPRVLVSYIFYLETIGNRVVLPCRAKGHPKPHITWTNSKGQAVKKDPRMKVLRSGELVISELRWGDMGDFTCTASNVFGTQQSKTFLYPAKAG